MADQESATIDWSGFRRFVDEFRSETDRAAVILGAAKLDELLLQLLDRLMLPSLASSDELLGGDAPLSTFSARINLCYRLGVISPRFAKSLHLVRRIRNSFAHEPSGCSLDEGPQADRLRALLLPLRPLPFFCRFRDHFFGSDVTPTVDFKACLALMAARLEARLYELQPLEDDDAWDFPVKAWADPDLGAAAEATDSAA